MGARAVMVCPLYIFAGALYMAGSEARIDIEGACVCGIRDDVLC